MLLITFLQNLKDEHLISNGKSGEEEQPILSKIENKKMEKINDEKHVHSQELKSSQQNEKYLTKKMNI